MLKLISAIILAVIFIGYAVYKKESIVKTWNNTVDGFKYMLSKMKELGFLGTLKIIFDDIFKNRTLGQWIYLLILGFMPFFIELYFNHHITDWLGMIASLTGIILSVVNLAIFLLTTYNKQEQKGYLCKNIGHHVNMQNI